MYFILSGTECTKQTTRDNCSRLDSPEETVYGFGVINISSKVNVYPFCYNMYNTENSFQSILILLPFESSIPPDEPKYFNKMKLQ
jgi:hypothetical protein